MISLLSRNISRDRAYRLLSNANSVQNDKLIAFRRLEDMSSTDPYARFALASIVSQADAGFFDKGRAVQMYKSCLRDGIVEAAWMLAEMYPVGKVRSQVLNKRQYWLQVGYNSGEDRCGYELAMMILAGLCENIKVSAAFTILRESIHYPNAMAAFELIRFCSARRVRIKEFAIARLATAARNRSTDACVSLGALGLSKFTRSQHVEHSVTYLKTAARADNIAAYLNLYAYFKKIGDEKSIAVAKRWRQRALNRGVQGLNRDDVVLSPCVRYNGEVFGFHSIDSWVTTSRVELTNYLTKTGVV